MKKIINKLFEKLGYVPKRENNNNVRIISNFTSHFNEIKEGKASYQIIQLPNCYVVTSMSTKDLHLAIKYFHFKNQDDKEYALICANELCDMLNAKY
jgi:hypothetical protein